MGDSTVERYALTSMQSSRRSAVLRDMANLKKTDICFALDATKSMETNNMLNTAKATIRRIIDEVRHTLQDGHVRVGIVVFRDKDTDDCAVDFCDFKERPEVAIRWLERVQAHGGADVCEDVLSGVQRAAKLNWQGTTRVLYLMAQTPAHGSLFHTGMRPCSDVAAVEKAVKDVADHMKTSPRREIFRHLASKIYDLYCREPEVERWKFCLRRLQSQDIRLVGVSTGKDLRMYEQLRAWYCRRETDLPLDIVSFSADPNDFAKLIVKKTAESCIASTSSSLWRQPHLYQQQQQPSLQKKPFLPFSSTPDWSSSNTWPKLAGTVKSFGVNAKDSFDLTNVGRDEQTFRIEQRVFASGAMRNCYAMVDESDGTRWVAKVYKPGALPIARAVERIYEGDMRCQAVGRHLAKRFSTHCAEHHVEFIDAKLLIAYDGSINVTGSEYIAIEPFIEEDYIKYTSNAGYAGEDSELAEAFSHFTWEESNSTLLVTDIQGGKTTFTDPQVHAVNERYRHAYGRGNMGNIGVSQFFLYHQCGDICRKAGNKKLGNPVLKVPGEPAADADAAAAAAAAAVVPDDVEEPLPPFLTALARDAALHLEFLSAPSSEHADESDEVTELDLAGMQVKFNEQGRLDIVATSGLAREAGVFPGTFIYEVNAQLLAHKSLRDCLTLLSQPQPNNRFVAYLTPEILAKTAAHKELFIRLKSDAQQLSLDVEQDHDVLPEAGITLAWNNSPTVVAIEEGSVAPRAGVKVGTIISKISGTETVGMSRQQLIGLLTAMDKFSIDDSLPHPEPCCPAQPVSSDAPAASASGSPTFQFDAPDRVSSHHAEPEPAVESPAERFDLDAASVLTDAIPIAEDEEKEGKVEEEEEQEEEEEAISGPSSLPKISAEAEAEAEVSYPASMDGSWTDVGVQEETEEEVGEQKVFSEHNQDQEQEQQEEEEEEQLEEEQEEEAEGPCKVCHLVMPLARGDFCSDACRDTWDDTAFQRTMLQDWNVI